MGFIRKYMQKNENKAMAYDNIVRQADRLQREISQLKAQYPINMPIEMQEKVEHNQTQLVILENKLKDLYR